MSNKSYNSVQNNISQNLGKWSEMEWIVKQLWRESSTNWLKRETDRERWNWNGDHGRTEWETYRCWCDRAREVRSETQMLKQNRNAQSSVPLAHCFLHHLLLPTLQSHYSRCSSISILSISYFLFLFLLYLIKWENNNG